MPTYTNAGKHQGLCINNNNCFRLEPWFISASVRCCVHQILESVHIQNVVDCGEI